MQHRLRQSSHLQTSSNQTHLCRRQPLVCHHHRDTPSILAAANEHTKQLQEPQAQQCSTTLVHHQQDSSTNIRPPACSKRSILRSAASISLSAAASALSHDVLAPQPAKAYIVDETVAQSVFAIAARSVASINDFKLQGGAEVFEGVGTGIVWDKYGHIVTNYHCVSKYVLDKSGRQVVKVILDDGSSSSSSSTYTAKIIGTDAMHDLAVLQVDAPRDHLVPICMGTSGDLKVGQSVYAVGNPYGFTKTLTAGVVSGLNRTIPAPTGTRIYGAIQTDASINAGNSGGPLLDSFARLIGINTASFTRSGTGRSSGVNFALPADLVMEIVPNLIVYGTAAGRGVRAG